MLNEGLDSDWRAGINLGSYLHKPRHGIIEEPLVSLAEIAFSAKAFLIKRSSILHTAAATDGKMPADKTFVTEILLGSGKGPLLAAGGQFLYRRFKNVA